MSTFDLARPPRQHRVYLRIRRLYRRRIEPRLVLSLLARQRLKLLWFGWGYGPLLRLPALSLWQKLWLLWRCLRIDWNVPHAHEPLDCVDPCRAWRASCATRGSHG